MTHDIAFKIAGCLLQLPAIIALWVAIKKKSLIWLLVAVAIAGFGIGLMATLAVTVGVQGNSVMENKVKTEERK